MKLLGNSIKYVLCSTLFCISNIVTAQPISSYKVINPEFIKNGKLDQNVAEWLKLRDRFFECNNILGSVSEQATCHLEVANKVAENSKRILASNKLTQEMYQTSLLLKTLPQARNRCNTLYPEKLKSYFMPQIVSCHIQLGLQNYKEIILFNHEALAQQQEGQ